MGQPPVKVSDPPDQRPARGPHGEVNPGEVIERDAALDGLRGVALCMVLLQHGFNPYPNNLLTAAVHAVAESMFIAIDLFFVLSGYLITCILLRTTETPGYFKNFYIRRALRVFPAYYIVLGFVLLFHTYEWGQPPAAWQTQMARDAPFYLLYLQNVVMAVRGTGGPWVGLDHTWSMPVEEQFYLLWPIVVMLIPRHRMAVGCLLIACGSIIAKLMMHWANAPMWSMYVTTLSHAEGLALGAALGAAVQIHNWQGPPRWFRATGLASAVYLIVTLSSWDDQHVLHTVVASVFFGWVLMETISAPRTAVLRRVLELRWLRAMGNYSYGVYLIHYPVLWVLSAYFWMTWKSALGVNLTLLALGITMVSITFPLAIAMYHGVEEPMLRLKRYFAPSARRLQRGVTDAVA
jgi:peptidoglycan/LPS O-acetylase OafA/YrhL